MKTPTFLLATTLTVLAFTASQSSAHITVATPAFAWGSQGSGEGEFNVPRGVAVAPNGEVYVADALNYRIQRFTADGTFISMWGSQGSGDGELNGPLDLDIDADANIFVLDTSNHRVQKFDAEGNFLLAWGSRGAANGQFIEPRAMDVDQAGNIYVSDTDNHRVQKFNGDGVFMTKLGGFGTANGKLNNPVGIVVDKQGNIYVADQTNYRIQKFASDGTFVRKWGSRGAGPGQFQILPNANGAPHDLAIDAAGNVLAADGGNHRIQVFTSNGDYIIQFGGFGSALGKLNQPVRMAFNPAGTLFYVADIVNVRYQAFNYTAPPPAILSSVKDGGNVAISWSAVAGRAYQVQYKTALTDANWTNIGSAVVAAGYPASASITVNDDAHRFFRIAVLE